MPRSLPQPSKGKEKYPNPADDVVYTDLKDEQIQRIQIHGEGRKNSE